MDVHIEARTAEVDSEFGMKSKVNFVAACLRSGLGLRGHLAWVHDDNTAHVAASMTLSDYCNLFFTERYVYFHIRFGPVFSCRDFRVSCDSRIADRAILVELYLG